MTIHRVNPCKRWSDVTVFNGIAHFVEVAESDTSAGMQSQVQQIFDQAETMLQSIGSDKSRILSVTVYVTDFANFDALNEVWDSWFPEQCAPSRACVKVELADPNLLVEMAFVAAAGDDYLP
ncbi:MULTISPECIES: RidA family protein [Vibrio]|uniref:RidA family protein n=1 Tax=Vibrio qingdaonensis TaxID=2829491 RepID=A0A9X3CMF2_9VIBR|nr:RidA family protein [Vibrio qingdaonensis]MCW8346061.1 RidA family protein [Vibrio qingdaonensis]